MTAGTERVADNLSAAEQRRGADREPGAVVVPCPDGPLLVRGDFDIVTPEGDVVPRRRRTVALCRCGASAIKPFCDGSHKVTGFRTEPPGGGEDDAAGSAGT